MKKIFTLFAALMMVFSMNAATKTIYCKMAQSWWKADGAAVGAYYWGTESGPAWPGVRMTPVSGETDLWSIDIDTDKFQNIIFTRVNGSGTVADWGAKTADLTVPTDDKNLYTITSTSPVWGSPGVAGNWSVYAPDAPKTYKDITITIVANATPKIHYWEGGDKVVGTEWDAKPEMVATGEENTYSYTIKEVDEATGVKYLVVVGEVQSADQQAFEDVNKNFKELLPQVAVMGINNWDGTDKMTVADDYLTASVTLTLEAAKDYELKLTVNGEWFGSNAITITKDNNSASFAENGDGNGKLTTDLAGDYVFTYTYATKTLVVTYPAPAEPEYEVMELTMTNLQVSNYGEATGLWASDTDNGIEVMLFLDAEGNLMAESSIMVSWMDYNVTGTVTKAYNEELATDVYTAELYTTVGETNYKLIITMYSAPVVATPVVVENAEIDDQTEETGFMYMTGVWTDAEGVVYPVKAEVPGFDITVAEAVYKNVTVTVGGMGDEDPWLGFVQGDATITVAENVVTLAGTMSSWDGLNLDITITGTLPVIEDPDPVKPEPIYTENNLNPYAFGLESELSVDNTTLTVTYRLNNSNATEVNVVVYNGEDIVALVPGTTTIGVNTVEVATGNLPAGVELKWAVEVKGTSVETPTQETKMYSMYCPHGLAIDKDPESEYFGRILVAEAMQAVPASGYVTSGKGAGLYVFNPSFTTDSVVYTGGNDFTRILASNGYQPWRVKISEDGRIFVSSLDLNGVVVWEVSKDLQTWTPVISGTNDATDYNIYQDSIFVAGLNCSMDVTGSGENLKLLLYSTNNKGIAFNQSGYRLDEYALGTATTWTGAPKNILEGGKYGVVHTNVEWIYDGEGGYWFGGSRAGNAGQANLAHINAEGVEDYRSEDASLYGGDGVLVHNGMLFKGKARTSGTVGNFGVWTIGKDADGKVTLTEKWSVVADGIGRNLNEFAVDYAENLYVVGNSGEKIIAYALPYSGTVETPAAAQYAFQLPEPVKMAGVVKRAVQNGDEVIVLTHEADGTAHLYQVVDGKAVAELSQEGVIARDPENAGDLLAISDIAVTEDGKLLAINKIVCQAGDAQVDEGYKRGETRVYIWNDLAGAPSVWFTSKMSSNWYRSVQGHTMAYKGTSTNGTLVTTGVTATGVKFRYSVYNVIDGVYNEPAVNDSEHYHFTKGDAQTTDLLGANYEINMSLLAENTWVLDGELVDPFEITDPLTYNTQVTAGTTITEDLGKKYNGASYVTVEDQVLMVAPFANPDGELVGAEILNITNGFDAPQYVDMVYVDEAVAATAAATAVQVVEGGLNITLVADATIYTWNVKISNEVEPQVYEDVITNLVIDYDNMLLIGGPSDAFQVEVVLGLGDYDRNTDNFALLPESSISVLGSEATFIDGIASVDGIAQTALAVVHCMWNGMALEFHLTMSAAPLEATVVVVENAAIEIEKYLLWGDMYDYALKMTGVWNNEEDGLDYPVLVEVPVYYPEATEPYEMYSTVTVGGMGDEDPWLGFGEGYLTITQEGDKITAAGIVENASAGIAIDITISGTVTPTGIENATVTVKSVKMIKNGQLIIEKDGVQFNAQGAIVK